MVKIAENFKSILSAQSVQLLVGQAAQILTGIPLLAKPEISRVFTATDIAEEAGVSPNKIGRLANALNLKTDEYGIWILDKSRHSPKHVKTFIYNDKGRQRLMEAAKCEKKCN